MKKPSRALFERNAKACEQAKHPRCKCVCGGAFHGKSHSAMLSELWAAYRARDTDGTPDLVDEARGEP